MKKCLIMRKYKSFLTISHPNYTVPPDSKINEIVEELDYEHYVPNQVLRDLINIASYSVLNIDVDDSRQHRCVYTQSLVNLYSNLKIKNFIRANSPVYVAVQILKEMNKNSIDFRLLEKYRELGVGTENCINYTFNYKFDLDKISKNVIDFLNISQDQQEQIAELPEEIIDVLNFNNDIGDSLIKTRVVTTSSYDTMKNYGQVSKVNKTKFVQPQFSAKLAVKDFDVKSTETRFETGNKLIIALSTNIVLGPYIPLIFRLCGVLALSHQDKGLDNDISIYIDFGTRIEKYDVDTLSASLDMFKGNCQTSMFNDSNTSFLSRVTFEEPNSTILFIPIFTSSCAISNSSLNGCSINMLVPSHAKLMSRFRFVCNKTGGKVVAI